jgi:tRNA dimethylallyltransferase
MSSCSYPAIAILGPTGSGKSRLGASLALRFHGEIVSCDALQVYQGMDIGTAKATRQERALLAYHMLDLRTPSDDFSAGDYQRLARKALDEIRSRNRVPFVVGGTGFYFRALTEGFFEGPGRSPWLRARLRRIVDRRGSRSLHAALGRVDPTAAARIAPADSARIIRAYEIYLMTGKTMTCWQQRPRDALQGFRWLKLGISWPREILYQGIDRRVEEMFEGGFVEEVRSLLGRFSRNSQAFKAIGYRQIAEYLEGKCSLECAREDTKMESRRYAKRQLTWFRSKRDILWLEAAADLADLEPQSAHHIAEFLKS